MSSPQPVEKQLAVLQSDIVACTKCDRLRDWCEKVAVDKRASYASDDYWGKPVAGFGDPHAAVMVVGLAPAAHGANRTGRVFTGDRSGDWLFRSMHRAGFANQAHSVSVHDGLVLTGAFVSAAVRCAPPANKPTRDERTACQPFIERELAILQPLVIVALGAFALDALAAIFGLRPRPKFGHLVEVPVPSGPTIVCSFHPSQQNTFTGRLTEPMLDAVFERASAIVRC